jgi:pimeloyl-ACP methyl ester carboxylesterase
MTFHDLTWRSHDGLKLHARDYPPAVATAAKTPVICIHGLTRNARDFEDLAPRIAALGRRVLAVDVRGRGDSDRDPNPANYHPGSYAADILALLDDQKIETAVFIGTSMGGLITMTLFALRPAAVAGVVLNDIGPELSPVGLARIAGYVGQAAPPNDWVQAAAYAKAINGAAFPDYGASDWTAFARRMFRDSEAGAPVLDYDPDIAVAFKPVDPPPPPVDLWPLFKAMTAGRPALLVRGEISDLIDTPICERMRTAAPTMAYAEAPRVGHAPMLTEPPAWSAITALLGESL